MKKTLADLVAKSGMAAVLATLSQMVQEEVRDLEEEHDDQPTTESLKLEAIGSQVLAAAAYAEVDAAYQVA